MFGENCAKNTIKIGLEMGKFGWYFGQELGAMVLRAADEKLLHPPDIQELRRAGPLHDALIGMDALARGRAKDIPELQFVGEAVLVHAAVKAEDDESINQRVVDQVVELVADSGVNPELSPLVSDVEAEKAKELIVRNNRVINFFPNQTGK